MFDFFKTKIKVIKQKREHLVDDSNFAPGTQIRYHPELIKGFKKDHKDLLERFQEVVIAYNGDNDQEVRASLKKLKQLLTRHLLDENLKFYIYLKHIYKSAPVKYRQSSKIMETFGKEMLQIGKVVFSFLDRYTAKGIHYDQSFKDELDAIGGALVQRIKAEEKGLYPLYISPPEVN